MSVLLRGLIDPGDANAALHRAGYRWLHVIDNGRVRSRSAQLGAGEVRAYHLLPVGVSKATGVGLHMSRAGISREAAAAIGDSPADAELAGVVGTVFDTAPKGAAGSGESAGGSPSGADGFAGAVRQLLQ